MSEEDSETTLVADVMGLIYYGGGNLGDREIVEYDR
jgi:hypothetical protein